MPDPIGAFVATGWFEPDAMNGGFAQFVANQGQAAEEALVLVAQGYETMGLPEMASLARRALEIATSEQSLRRQLGDRDSVDEFVSFVEASRLPSLDDNLEETTATRAAWIRQHAEAFAG
jgi:hypothetical protein